MAAPKGNKNAEKWTLIESKKLFDTAIELANQKEIITMRTGSTTWEQTQYKYDFIGEVAKKLGTCHQMITQHLPERFPSLQRLKTQLINNLEANCYVNTKKGMIREATGIVNLKSNHKWTDRIDQTSKGDKVIQYQNVSKQFPNE